MLPSLPNVGQMQTEEDELGSLSQHRCGFTYVQLNDTEKKAPSHHPMPYLTFRVPNILEMRDRRTR